MWRTISIAALALVIGAFLLNWLEYQFVTRIYSTEFYIFLIACLFAAGGVLLGARLTRKPAPPEFQRNAEAIAYLNISAREEDVLTALADGRSNKEIARDLGVSPNTVKTHLSNLYEKLEVSRRTQAIRKARELRLIP